MGRLSDVKNNYSFSAGSVVAVIVVIALIAAGIWWWVQREPDGTQAEPAAATTSGAGSPTPTSEVARDCTLVPVAATDDSVGELLVANWGSGAGMDCVEVELVTSLDDAALLIAPDSPATQSSLAESGREVSGTPIAVAAVPAGLAGPDAETDVDPTDVSFPTATQPEASVLVAEALGATGELGEDPAAAWTATTQDQAPAEAEFSALDGTQLVYHAHPLTPAEDVSAQQIDAAGVLATSAGENYEGPATSPAVGDDLWAAAGYGDAAPQAELVPNTLFLLDTSQAMTPFADAAATAVGGAAQTVTDSGELAGLWNYSSPLNPGVTQGWRRNINYTDGGDDIGWAAQRFGNAGQPQTRSAVVAALANARGQANDTGQPARVVLVTSGTAADLDDEAFTAELERVNSDDVALSVIHVGPGTPDGVLQEAADLFLSVADGAGLPGAVADGAGL